ncbi:putative terminal uridylyltransferase 3, partial [Trypanosoma rangeli]
MLKQRKRKPRVPVVNVEAPPAVATEAPKAVSQEQVVDAVQTEQNEDGCDDAGSVSAAREDEEEGEASADAVQELRASNGEGQGYLRCDLCNEVIDEEEHLHHQRNHMALMHWCDRVLSVWALRLRTTPVPPEHCSALGLFVLEIVSELDKGPAAFALIQRASEQLNGVAQSVLPSATVFLFGSCVASGSWDGVSDADFTVLEPSLVKLFAAGALEHPDERRHILRIASALRNSGFLHNELEVVIKTRVPVVKRNRKVQAPLLLPDAQKGYKLDYVFLEPQDNRAYKDFVWEARRRNIRVDESNTNKLTLHFHSALQALRYYRTRVRGLKNVVKAWKPDHQLPDIFALDFDISCRPLGVRNSWFMREYLSQHSVVRAGVAFLKRWSKQCGINNAQKGYLTSYAVMILWVYYLLQRGLVCYVDPVSVSIVPSGAPVHVPYIPLLGVEGAGGGSMGSVSSSPVLAELKANLGDCVAGFFSFYSEFPWDERVVSLRSPNSDVTRESLGWVEAADVMAKRLRDRVWYRMCIEDPYEDNLNLGRHLSPNKFAFVRSQFVVALGWVMGGRPEQLLLDTRAVADATLRAHLHHLVYAEGLKAISLPEARDYILSRVDEETLAYYEVQHPFDSICEMLMSITVSGSNSNRSGDTHSSNTGKVSIADVADGADAKADGADTKADGADAKADGADAKADGADTKADGADAKADGADAKADGADAKADGA